MEELHKGNIESEKHLSDLEACLVVMLKIDQQANIMLSSSEPLLSRQPVMLIEHAESYSQDKVDAW